MSEKDDKVVSDKEIADVEKEIASKQAEEMKKLSVEKAKEIEGKVRSEYEAKEKEKQLNDRLAKIEEENKSLKKEAEDKIKAQEEKIKTQEETFKKQLEDALAVKKGVATNKSPFDEPDKKDIKIVDGEPVDVSKLDYNEIEKLSAEEFRRYHGLPRHYFSDTDKS